jgi:hypothetical protein
MQERAGLTIPLGSSASLSVLLSFISALSFQPKEIRGSSVRRGRSALREREERTVGAGDLI